MGSDRPTGGIILAGTTRNPLSDRARNALREGPGSATGSAGGTLGIPAVWSRSWSALRHSPPGLGWCLAAVILSRLLAYRSFCVFDDAFITYRYGASFAAGNGLVYNVGEHILGTTAPAFALLCAGILALGGAPEIVVPLLNIGFDAAIVVLAWHFVFRDAAGEGSAFTALFALSPVLARVCVGGMEADFFTLQTLAALICHFRGRRVLAAALAGASYFTRPEGVVTVAVLVASELIDRRIDRAFISGIVAACVVAPVFAIIKLTYGQVLPQSVVAKGLHTHVSPLEVVHLLLAPEPVAAAVVILAVVGTVPAIGNGGVLRMAALWFWLYVAAFLYGGPHVWSWYSFPPVTMAALLAAPIVRRGWLLLASRLTWRPPGSATAIMAVMVVAAWALLSFALGPDRITRNIYRPVAEFCRDVGASDSVLASDIGIIGYRCPVTVIDAAGLVSPSSLGYASEFDLIRDRKPRFLFLTASADLQDQTRPDWFAAAYRPVARFAADGDVDPAHLKNRGHDWSQEYIAYQSK
jgi:hypothetical protein